MLIKFYQEIDDILAQGNLKEQLPLLRDLLKHQLTFPQFRVHCIQELLRTLEQWHSTDRLWPSPPIFYHPHYLYAIRLLFWPVDFANNPHQHKTWSITGVFHNQLTINTYDLISTNALQLKQRFLAQAGDVGYLFPGCIHNVSNPGQETAISLHIFNHLPDSRHAEDNAIWYPPIKKYDLAHGLVERALLACLSVAEGIDTPQALQIIDHIYHLLSFSSAINKPLSLVHNSNNTQFH